MPYDPRHNNPLNRRSYIKREFPSNSEGRNGDLMLCLLPKGFVLCFKLNNK